MTAFFETPFFGVALTILAYWAMVKLQQKLKSQLANPLLLSIVVVSAVLIIFKIPYSAYDMGGTIINMFLGPATACLAVSIYSKRQLLKKNWLPVVVGCTVGSLTSMTSIYVMCKLFKLDDTLTMALLPKSVTTPIAVSISGAHGGIVPVTVVAVIITGVLGSIFAPLLIKIFNVKEPFAQGLAIGASSHAVGTSKAIELGEAQGAMSGLAIGVCGVITVLFSLFIS